MRDADEIALWIAIAKGGSVYLDELNNWPHAITWLRNRNNNPESDGTINPELMALLA